MIALQCTTSIMALVIVGWLFWNRVSFMRITYNTGRELIILVWPLALVIALALIGWVWWGG